MRRITKLEPTKVPKPPQKKRVAAYARISKITDRMSNSLSNQVSTYSKMIQDNFQWEYAGVYVDAINVCGGVLPNVDKDSINMAQVLKDGQQLRVPERKEGTSSGSRSSNNGSKEGQININTADEKTLDELPGVGPAMAKRIVEYRETEGAFQSIEDIKKIKGIGEAKFNRMKDKLCL